MRKFAIASLLFLCTAPAFAQDKEGRKLILKQGSYFLYNEPESCALYIEDDLEMLRVSYRRSTDQVYFTLYSDRLKRMPIDNKVIQGSIASTDDPNNLLGMTGRYVSNGEMTGLHMVGSTEILDWMQGSTKLSVYAGPMMITQVHITGVDRAIRQLKQCAFDK